MTIRRCYWWPGGRPVPLSGQHPSQRLSRRTCLTISGSRDESVPPCFRGVDSNRGGCGIRESTRFYPFGVQRLTGSRFSWSDRRRRCFPLGSGRRVVSIAPVNVSDPQWRLCYLGLTLIRSWWRSRGLRGNNEVGSSFVSVVGCRLYGL